MNLSAGHIARMKIIVPPITEQAGIVEHARTSNERIDAAVANKEQQIAALKAYKTTLINAAVTGKIKVA